MVSFDQTIPPGGRGKIELKFNTAGYKGRVRKSAVVQTNDPAKSRFDVVLRVDVKPIFLIKPWARVALSTSVGKPTKQVLTLTNQLEQPVELTDLDIGKLQGFISAQLVTVEKGRAYELVVQTDAAVPLTRHGYVKMNMSGVPVKELGIFTTLVVWKPPENIPKMVIPKKSGS